jgi:hypothetical protein
VRKITKISIRKNPGFSILFIHNKKNDTTSPIVPIRILSFNIPELQKTTRGKNKKETSAERTGIL